MKTSSKIWMCLAGIALVALGVLCIMYPGETLLSLAWLFGLIFFVGGCTQMAAWASTRWFMPRSGLMFFSALLEILLGCLMVFHPAPVMLALPFIFAFWLIFEGVDMAIGSFDFKLVGFRNWWVLPGFGGSLLWCLLPHQPERERRDYRLGGRSGYHHRRYRQLGESVCNQQTGETPHTSGRPFPRRSQGGERHHLGRSEINN